MGSMVLLWLVQEGGAVTRPIDQAGFFGSERLGRGRISARRSGDWSRSAWATASSVGVPAESAGEDVV